MAVLSQLSVSQEGDPIGDFDDLFYDFDSVPADPKPKDGDNSILADATWANPHAVGPALPVEKNLLEKASKAYFSTVAPTKNIVVPHPRDLRYKGDGYMTGPDVTALDRGLWRSGTYKHRKGTPFRFAFGPGMRDHLKKFQSKHGLKADGVYGLGTHKVMVKYYDQRCIWLVNQVKPKVTPADKIVAAAMIGYNYRDKIHYTQGPARMYLTRNRIQAVNISKQYSIWEDCSSFATYLFWQAGLSDPNGFGYNGFGYTGTLSQHGSRIYTPGAPVGSLSFYGGSYPYHHVAIRISTGGRVVSHGSESGPLILDTNYRSDLRQTRKYF